MKRITILAFSLTLLLAGTAQGAEQLQATAMNIGGAIQSGQLIVHLSRYTTDDERAEWRKTFDEGGQKALIERWQKEKMSVGSCSFAQTLGYDLRAAVSIPTESGGRKIYMATDRPIAGFEVMRGARSADYPIAWIEVEVDAEGKGEGRLIGMAEFTVEDKHLVMKTFGTEPVRLTRVTIREKK